MDTIEIKDLRVETHIGVTEEERSRSQKVVIGIQIGADLSRAGASDDLNDTLDYDAIVKRTSELVRSAEWHLLEHLAERIAASISPLDGVVQVTVEVRKEKLPLDEDVSAVSVRLVR